MAAGQRPISNVVDITNYVMLTLGQPMHAYDLDRIAGPELRVRAAREGERLTTLDGEQRVFDSDAVLVCDADGPTGIGGIMGGATSEVSETTTRVAMEAATWNGTNILQTSKKLGLRSEASTRFEKQLHPRLALQAQRLAARLMVELCGARMVAGHDRRRRSRARAASHRAAHRAPAGRCWASASSRRSRGEILERLGFEVEPQDGDVEVDRALLAALRRVPRGRPDRGGRPRARPRPAADHAAGPRARPSAGSRRRSGCAARSRTSCAGAASARPSTSASSRPTRSRCLRLDQDATRGRRAARSPTRSARTSR